MKFIFLMLVAFKLFAMDLTPDEYREIERAQMRSDDLRSQRLAEIFERPNAFSNREKNYVLCPLPERPITILFDFLETKKN